MDLDARLRAVMAAVLKVPAGEIGEASSMDTIASWDSLQHMNLVLALEEEFGITVPDEDAANITSFRLIRAVVQECLAR
jgi:acyl carrier protein